MRQSRKGVPVVGRFVRVTAILAVVLTLLPLSVALADLDPAVRQAVGAASVKLAALVTAQENGATEEIEWPLGSATIVSPDGILLTNAHVVDLSGLVTRLAADEEAFKRQGRDRRLRLVPGRYLVFVTDGADLRRRYIADMVVADPVLDLAVLRLSAGAHGEPIGDISDLPFLSLGDSDALQPGDELHVFGYPGTAGGTLKYTRGFVSGFDFAPGILGWAWIDSDATVSGGSSGGTAVDDTGLLIGVPTLATPLDCRPGDTNGDGTVDESDIGCVPIGDSFLRLRPINQAKPLLSQVSDFFEALLPTPTQTVIPTPTVEVGTDRSIAHSGETLTAQVVHGRCDSPGDSVGELREPSPSEGGALTSFTRIGVPIDELTGGGYAVLVLSDGDVTACGDITGGGNDVYVPMMPQGEAGYYGVAWLHAREEETQVSLFIF